MNTRKGMFTQVWIVICLCLPLGSISANEHSLASGNKPLTQAQLADVQALYTQPATTEALSALAQQLNLQLDTRGQFIQRRHL